MSIIEGKISIDFYRDKAATERVSLVSDRPVHASRVMHGKSPEQALELLPLLFNVCAVAQARTAVSAIESRLGLTVEPAVDNARDLLVLVETAREHLMRVLIDWPMLFDLPTDTAELPLLGRLINDFRQALFQDGQAFTMDSIYQPDDEKLDQLIEQLDSLLARSVFDGPCLDWLELKGKDELMRWAQTSKGIAASTIVMIENRNWSETGEPESTPLPADSVDAIIQRLNSDNADNYIAMPDLDGQACETTSYTRQAGHPLVLSMTNHSGGTLLTRWVARLVELAHIPDQIRALRENRTTIDDTPRAGFAQTEAARGRLSHYVEIDADKIAHYRILAPTEWNFHPDGIACRSLASLDNADPDQIKLQAQLLINVIDPCVGYDLRVH